MKHGFWQNLRCWRALAALSSIIAWAGFAVLSCQGSFPLTPGEADRMSISITVTSPAFVNDAEIPAIYTAQGEEQSPPLAWRGVNPGVQSLAIIMEDTAIPLLTVTHWLIWNIPASVSAIPANLPHDKVITTLGGACQGKNIYGKIGYLGPNPPFGTHTYRFTVYALDTVLSLQPGASNKQLQQAMQGHIMQSGQLKGKFHR